MRLGGLQCGYAIGFTSLAQEVGEGLGAQAGETRLAEVISSGGFSRVRRATEGPFNMVLQARA